MSYLSAVLTQPAPQTEPELGRELEQVQNNAGGFVFQISPEDQLDRFLVLGTESGTYYAQERALTLENARNIQNMIQNGKGHTVINHVVDFAHRRAPKIGPPLFALAMVAALGTDGNKVLAFDMLPEVARTSSHLFQFIQYIDAMRGWGRTLKNGINHWYMTRTPSNLAYQLVKYRTRNGWSHRDVFRKTHPKSLVHNNLLAYATNKPWVPVPGVTDQIEAFEAAKTLDIKDLPAHITKHELTWEMLPTESLTSPDVWRALLPHMPATALLRNLGRLSRLEVLKPLSTESEMVRNTIADPNWAQRLHPFNILIAYANYREGKALRGKTSWTPVQPIVDALEHAFHNAFEQAPPTRKKIYIGLDVSGSMCAPIYNTALSAREAAAALVLHLTHNEPNYHVSAFSHEAPKFQPLAHGTFRFPPADTPLIPLHISPNDNLSSIMQKTSRLPHRGTDCALPMLDALEKKLDVDCFVVITDNETWAGRMHPGTALKKYRAQMNKPNAQLIVIAMTSTGFSIADPQDPKMLDIVGFDAAMTTVMREFMLNN